MKILENIKEFRNRAHSLIANRKRIYDNRIIADNLYKRDPKTDELELSEKTNTWLKDLKEFDIIKICNEFNWVKDIFNKEYYEKKK